MSTDGLLAWLREQIAEADRLDMAHPDGANKAYFCGKSSGLRTVFQRLFPNENAPIYPGLGGESS